LPVAKQSRFYNLRPDGGAIFEVYEDKAGEWFWWYESESERHPVNIHSGPFGSEAEAVEEGRSSIPREIALRTER